MNPNQIPQPSAETDPIRSAMETIAEFKRSAESAHMMRADADPNAWRARTEQYLEEHPDICKNLFERFWIDYIRQELASTYNGRPRTIASVKRMDKMPDSPSGEPFDTVNKIVLKIIGGSGPRETLINGILDRCESGELDC